MGAFPAEPSLAWQLIAVCSTAASLLGADKVVVKTPEEALGVPTVEANSAAVRAVRYVLDMFPEGRGVTNSTVDEEAALIGDEVDRLLERIFDDPAPSFLQSVFRAVLAGTIDIPFAPHQQNASRLVTERGAGRRIRILDPGSVPVSAADLRRERALAGAGGAQEGPLWERLLRDLHVLA
jgi:methylaspartate mutase epsilon subunit